MSKPTLKAPKYRVYSVGGVWWTHTGTSTTFETEELAQVDCDKANARYAQILSNHLAPDEELQNLLKRASTAITALAQATASLAEQVDDGDLDPEVVSMVDAAHELCKELEAHIEKPS